MKSIVIFGGAGFVGKHLIRKVSKFGYNIIVPYQKSTNEAELKLLGQAGQIIPYYYQSLGDKKLIKIIQNAETCINLKTSWSEKNQSFKKSIYEFNVDLISILKKSNISKKLIFFSGLGVDTNMKSHRNKAILEVENYITNNLNNAAIIRPSVILGGGDQFISGLLPYFKLSLFIPLFGNGKNIFQPVHIEDICKLVFELIDKEFQSNQILELGGPDTFSFIEFYSLIAKSLNKKRILIPLPMLIIKIFIRLAEKISLSPLTLEQLSLFEQNNIVTGKKLGFEKYNIRPQNIFSILNKLL